MFRECAVKNKSSQNSWPVYAIEESQLCWVAAKWVMEYTTLSLAHRNLKHSFCLLFNIITTTLWSAVSRKKKISHNTWTSLRTIENVYEHIKRAHIRVCVCRKNWSFLVVSKSVQELTWRQRGYALDVKNIQCGHVSMDDFRLCVHYNLFSTLQFL